MQIRDATTHFLAKAAKVLSNQSQPLAAGRRCPWELGSQVDWTLPFPAGFRPKMRAKILDYRNAARTAVFSFL